MKKYIPEESLGYYSPETPFAKKNVNMSLKNKNAMKCFHGVLVISLLRFFTKKIFPSNQKVQLSST
jgi:hypothetical protein